MRISDWSSDVCSSDLVAAGEADLRGMEKFGTDDEHRRDEDAGDDIGNAVVEPHHPHPGGRMPTLGVDPIAIGGERERAADAADQAKGVDYRTVWKARNEPAQRSEERRGGKEGVRKCRSRLAGHR